MEIPVQVTFRDIQASDAVRDLCISEAEKLERYRDRITSCRVVVGTPHKHQKKGALFSVRIDLTVPGKEVVVNRDHGEKHAHEDCMTAVRDAFRAARRQLETFKERQRGDVKHHEEAPHGSIRKVVPEENFGFIETHDGRELYFHRNSVLNTDFETLRPGSEVRFVEEQGDKGPQATSVKLLGLPPSPPE